MSRPSKYFAFISYSHADKAWGAWLHRGIETYRVPKTLVGRENTRSSEPVPARLFPVFRDREELPTSADLGTMLRQALDDSRYLVVICTPRSANSKWVNEEVLHFKRSGRANRVLCLIADGEPNASAGDATGAGLALECFPPAVRHPVDENGNLDVTRFEEPIAADARPQGDGKRAALLKLIAGLAEVGLDELRQRDHERARSIMLRWLAASAVLVLLLGGLAVLALAEKKRAQQTLSSSDFYQADEWMRRGEPHAALLHLSRAVATDPDNAAALLRLACVLKQDAWPYEIEEPTGPGQDAGVRDLLPVADGRQVIVQTSQGYQQVWEVPGKALSPPLLHDEVEWAGRLSFVAVAQPGGARMASGGHDGKVQLRNLPTGTVAGAPHDIGGQVIALASDTSGRTLAAGSDKGRVVWMDWEGGAKSMTEDSGARVTAIALRANGSAMAAAIGDGMVRLWTDAGSSTSHDLQHPAKVNALAFSPDGHWLVTGGHDGAVRVWDTDSGNMHQEHKLASSVGSLAFGPTRATLAAGWGYYGDVWRVTLLSMLEDGSLNVLHTVEHPLRDVGHRIGSSGFGNLAFSPDGERLLTWNAMDREVRCWSVTEGQMVMKPLLHAEPIGGAAFRGYDEILTGAADGLVRVWKWSPPAVPVTHALPPGYWIDGRWLSPSETWVGIARGEGDKGLLVIARRTSKEWKQRQIVLPDLALAFGLTPEADRALVGLMNGGLVRVDLTSETIQSVVGWEGVKADFIACIDQTRFLIATAEGRLLRGHDSSATPDESFELGDKARTMRLAPSRRWLVVGLDLKAAWWIPVDALAAATQLFGHELTVSAAAFSANGTVFATADYAGYVQAWTVEASPKRLFKVRQDAEVTALAFNDDGTILASGGRDDRVNCWAADRSGELLSSVKTPSWVDRLEFAADQRHVLVSMLSGRLGILDAWTGRWVLDVVSMKEDVVTSGWTREGIWGVQRQGIIHDWLIRPDATEGLASLGALLSRSRFTPGGGIQREGCRTSLLETARLHQVPDSALEWCLGQSPTNATKPRPSTSTPSPEIENRNSR